MLADEGYIRNTRWHVRPWKSITQNVDDIEDEKQVAQLAPSNLVKLRNSGRERRDTEERRTAKEATDTMPLPFDERPCGSN